MATDIEDHPLDDRLLETDEQFDYRPLSSIAVASLVMGVLSGLALLDWVMLAFPLVGIVLGVYAVRTVGRQGFEVSGLPLAKAGLGMSIAFLIAGFGWLTVSYAVEVPDGYRRVSYSQLQPGPDDRADHVPPSAIALDGQRIFIKGYVYPGKQTDGIQTFLLCRDQGDCCFGGDPKITDRILVKLVGDRRLTFKPTLQKVGGTFHVDRGTAVDAGGAVLYRLEADYLN
jgi:hypothetical protein